MTLNAINMIVFILSALIWSYGNVANFLIKGTLIALAVANALAVFG